MKVLHLHPYPPENLGGSEIFCKNLALNLSKFKNIQSDILTSDYFRNNIKKKKINKNLNVFYEKYYYNIWSKNPLVNIYSFLKNHYQRYDIIHAHSYIFFTSFQCALLRKFRKFPFLLHIHGGIQTNPYLSANFNEYFQLLMKKTLFDTFIGKFTIEKADSVISVSQKDLTFLEEKYKISKNKTNYVSNGVDINTFKFNPEIEKKYITFIGRLTHIKGFDIFIEIIKKIHKKNKNLKFLIVGDGPLRKLVELIKEEIPITFYPYYPYNLMSNIYNQTKLLILTSRFEGVPTTILESLSCETSVVSTNVGGISEIIQDGVNGILLNNQKNDENISRIMELIEDEEKLRIFGVKGRELIEKKFSWEYVTNQILNIYKKFT